MLVEVDDSLDIGVYKVNITLSDDNVDSKEATYRLIIVISESTHADKLLAKSSLETYESMKAPPSKVVVDSI